MIDPTQTKSEETSHEKYAKFVRLLTAIAAVPKTAIYELDPKLRPKLRVKNGESRPDDHS